VIARLAFRALAAAFAAFVSKARCAACDDSVARAVIFCPSCAATVDRPVALNVAGTRDDEANKTLIAPFVYGGAIATAITRFKYADRPDLARPLVELLCRELAAWSENASDVRILVDERPFELIVPVPLHPNRLAERRFNQSALLAARVARYVGAPMNARALDRTRDTPAQASLGLLGRRTNLVDAFVVRRARDVRQKRVLLVDDVCTTGATLSACAAALEAAGVASVQCAVVARVAR
jgi:ComF family protein